MEGYFKQRVRGKTIVYPFYKKPNFIDRLVMRIFHGWVWVDSKNMEQ